MLKRIKQIIPVLFLLMLFGCNQRNVIEMNLDDLILRGENVTYIETTGQYEVIGDINLMDAYQNTIIVWSTSSNEHLDVNTGKVTRSDDTVTITLTASVGTLEKTFELVIIKADIVYPHNGTYQLFQQGQSSLNGFLIQDKESKYFSYRMTIEGLEVIEEIIYRMNTSETITNQYTLIQLEENIYQHPENQMIYTYIPNIDAFEISLIESDYYEGVVLSKDKERYYYSTDVMYQINQSGKALEGDVMMSDYWYTYQINFSRNGQYQLYYTLEEEYLLDVNEYMVTPNFIFTYGSFKDIYLITDDGLRYDAENQLLPISQEYQTDAYRYDLISSQLPWYQDTTFIKDELLKAEALSILDMGNQPYQVMAGDIYNANVRVSFISDQSILDITEYDTTYYEVYDNSQGFIAYQLSLELLESTQVYETNAPRIAYDDFIKQLNGSYAKVEDVIYLKTTFGDLSSVFPFFDGFAYSKTIVLGIKTVNDIPVIEVFVDGSYYIGSILYVGNTASDFTLDDIKVLGTSVPIDGIKPVVLNTLYSQMNYQQDYYYRVVIDPGYYVFSSSAYLTVADGYEAIGEMMLYSMDHDMAYLETSVPLEFYIQLIDSSYSGVIEFLAESVNQKVTTEYALVENQAMNITRSQLFDESIIIDTMDHNVVYKMVYEGIDKFIALTLNGEEVIYGMSTQNQFLVYNFAFEAGDEIALTLKGSGVVTFYEVLDDEFGSTIDIDDTYISPRFTASNVFDQETFIYTHTTGETSFSLLTYGDNEPTAPQYGDKATYYETTSYIKITDALGEVVTQPIKTPGTYTIEIETWAPVHYFYLKLIQYKDRNQVISLPFETTTLYHPDYETVYEFTLLEKSFIHIVMDVENLLYLVDQSDDRVLWNIYGDYVITLDAGTYTIEKGPYDWPSPYQLKVENKGVSTALSFNQETIYTYPNTITLTFTYPNELFRLEFIYQTHLYYRGSGFIVFGSFNRYAYLTQLSSNTWTQMSFPDFENNTNLYYVSSTTLGNRNIYFNLKNF